MCHNENQGGGACTSPLSSYFNERAHVNMHQRAHQSLEMCSHAKLDGASFLMRRVVREAGSPTTAMKSYKRTEHNVIWNKATKNTTLQLTLWIEAFPVSRPKFRTIVRNGV